MDIKTAFLQGKPLNRDVFIKPPKEAKTTNLWMLKKYVYGLNEASSYWYNCMADERTKLGFIKSKYDETYFTGDRKKNVRVFLPSMLMINC